MNRRNFVVGALGAAGAAIAAPIAAANYIKPLKPRGVLGYSEHTELSIKEVAKEMIKLGFERDRTHTSPNILYFEPTKLGEKTTLYVYLKRYTDLNDKEAFILILTNKTTEIQNDPSHIYYRASTDNHVILPTNWKKDLRAFIKKTLQTEA